MRRAAPDPVPVFDAPVLTDGPSDGDLAWIACYLATIGLSNLWWRLETASSETRSSLLWVLSTSGVTLFLIGIVALGGTPTGIAAAAYAALGLIGIAALLGTRRRGLLDGRWLASRVAAWVFSIACVFAIATLIYTLIEWWSGNTPGIVSMAMITASCGMLWNPLFGVLQRVADGALFGFRPDALTAAQRVAVSIGTTEPPPSERSRKDWYSRTQRSPWSAKTTSRSALPSTVAASSRSTPTMSTSVRWSSEFGPATWGCLVTTNAY